jgi:hypothetical protein
VQHEKYFSMKEAMMKTFLKKITPEPVKALYQAYKPDKMKKTIIRHLRSIPENERSAEEQDILFYLNRHPLSMLPYSYTKKYKTKDVVVYRDESLQMHYVLHDSKRLYFKKAWDEEQVKSSYNALLIEQDVASPHRYETADFHVAEGDVVVDAGVAEGNFALSVVERAKELYLFESDNDWIAALEATFAPWKEKVVIVNKYISDRDNGSCITLDKFFGEEGIDFIKADVDGAEQQLLAGAKAILSGQTSMKVALCTYHKHNDAEMFNQMLTENGFHTEFSKGYMLFLMDKFAPPYLRRCLIRAVKIN